MSSSCHAFYCKKVIPWSQALRLDKICSYNELFDKIWYDSEKCLLERGYSEKMVREEMLRARAVPRDALLEKVNNQVKQNKIIFSITYYSVFRDVRKILKELHVILASEDEHEKAFPNVPMIDFKNNKNLKAHLLRLHLPDLDKVDQSKPCE